MCQNICIHQCVWEPVYVSVSECVCVSVYIRVSEWKSECVWICKSEYPDVRVHVCEYVWLHISECLSVSVYVSVWVWICEFVSKFPGMRDCMSECPGMRIHMCDCVCQNVRVWEWMYVSVEACVMSIWLPGGPVCGKLVCVCASDLAYEPSRLHTGFCCELHTNRYGGCTQAQLCLQIRWRFSPHEQCHTLHRPLDKWVAYGSCSPDHAFNSKEVWERGSSGCQGILSWGLNAELVFCWQWEGTDRQSIPAFLLPTPKCKGRTLTRTDTTETFSPIPTSSQSLPIGAP